MKLAQLILSNIFRFSLPVLAPITLLLSACAVNTPIATRDVSIGEVQLTVAPSTREPYVYKTSEPQTVTIHGYLVVLDPMSMIPAPDDAIYLVPLPSDEPISSIPQFEEGSVPQADVDERNGEFVFINIQPGQYAVVVVTKGGTQIPVRYMDNSSYAIFTLDSSHVDTTYDLGRLTLP